MPGESEIERMVVRILGDTSVLQKAVKQAQRVVGDLEQTEKELTRQEKELQAAQKRGAQITKQVENATETYAREMKELNSLLKKGTISQETFNRAQKTAQRTYRMSSTALGELGSKMQSIGRTSTLAVTLPIIGIGAAAIKAGSDLDSAFTGVKKTVEGSSEQLQKVRSDLEALGTTGGVAIDIEELMGIAEIGGQLGVARDDIIEFTKVSAAMGVATNLSSEEAGTALARISNIAGLTSKDFNRLGSSIVALGNSTATSESEIVSMTLRLAGAGTQVGMSIDQITALAASLSSVGIEAEAGGTSFSQLFMKMSTEVATSGKRLEDFARISGKSIDQFSKDFRNNAAGAVVDLLRGLKQLSGEEAIIAIKSLGLEGIRMSDSLLRSSNAVSLMEEALKTSSQAFSEGSALTAEAEQRYKSFKAQVTTLWNSLKLLGGEIFAVLEPALRSIINTVQDLTLYFKNLPMPVKAVVIAFIGVVAAIGPMVLALGGIIVTLATLKTAFATSAIAAAASAGATTTAVETSGAGVAMASSAMATAVETSALRMQAAYASMAIAAQTSSAMIIRSSGQAAIAQTASSVVSSKSAGLLGFSGTTAATSVAASNIIEASYKRVATSAGAATAKAGRFTSVLSKITGAAKFVLSSLTTISKSALSFVGAIGAAIAVIFVSVAGEGESFTEKLTSSMSLLRNLVSTVWYSGIIPAFKAGKKILSETGTALSEVFRGINLYLGDFLNTIGEGIGNLIDWGESLVDVITGHKEWSGSIRENIKAIHDLNKALGKGDKLTNKLLESNEKRFSSELQGILSLDVTEEKESGLKELQSRVQQNLDSIQSSIIAKNKELESIGGGPIRTITEADLKDMKARESQLKEHLARVQAELKPADQTPDLSGQGSVDDLLGQPTDIEMLQKADDIVSSLQERITTFGQPKEIIDLQNLNAAPELIEEAKAALETIRLQDVNQQIQDITKGFQDQTVTINMTTEEARLYKLELEGGDPELIKEARKALESLDAKKKAKQITKQFETPLQKFQDKQKELLKLKPELDEATYQRALDAAKDEFDKSKEQLKDLDEKAKITVEYKSEGVQAAASEADFIQRLIDHQDQLNELRNMKTPQQEVERVEDQLVDTEAVEIPVTVDATEAENFMAMWNNPANWTPHEEFITQTVEQIDKPSTEAIDGIDIAAPSLQEVPQPTVPETSSVDQVVNQPEFVPEEEDSFLAIAASGLEALLSDFGLDTSLDTVDIQKQIGDLLANPEFKGDRDQLEGLSLSLDELGVSSLSNLAPSQTITDLSAAAFAKQQVEESGLTSIPQEYQGAIATANQVVEQQVMEDAPIPQNIEQTVTGIQEAMPVEVVSTVPEVETSALTFAQQQVAEAAPVQDMPSVTVDAVDAIPVDIATPSDIAVDTDALAFAQQQVTENVPVEAVEAITNDPEVQREVDSQVRSQEAESEVQVKDLDTTQDSSGQIVTVLEQILETSREQLELASSQPQFTVSSAGLT